MTLLVGSIFHMTRNIVSEMTYNVSMGTLNPTILYHAETGSASYLPNRRPTNFKLGTQMQHEDPHQRQAP